MVVFHKTLLVAGEEAEEREDQSCGAAYCWDEGCEAHRDDVFKYAPCKMVLMVMVYYDTKQWLANTEGEMLTNVNNNKGHQSFTYTTRHDTHARTEVRKPWNALTRPFPSTSVSTGAVSYQKTCDDTSQPHDHPPGLPALVKTSRSVDVLSPTCCHDPCCNDAVGRDDGLSERLAQGLE
jgi:hypothetical protein